MVIVYITLPSLDSYDRPASSLPYLSELRLGVESQQVETNVEVLLEVQCRGEEDRA